MSSKEKALDSVSEQDITVTVILQYRESKAALYPPDWDGGNLANETIQGIELDALAMGIRAQFSRKNISSPKVGAIEFFWRTSPVRGIYRDIINWRDSVEKMSVDQPGFLPFIPLKSITVKCNRDSGTPVILPEVDSETDAKKIWYFWKENVPVKRLPTATEEQSKQRAQWDLEAREEEMARRAAKPPGSRVMQSARMSTGGVPPSSQPVSRAPVMSVKTPAPKANDSLSPQVRRGRVMQAATRTTGGIPPLGQNKSKNTPQVIATGSRSKKRAASSSPGASSDSEVKSERKRLKEDTAEE